MMDKVAKAKGHREDVGEEEAEEATDRLLALELDDDDDDVVAVGAALCTRSGRRGGEEANSRRNPACSNGKDVVKRSRETNGAAWASKRRGSRRIQEN